MSIRVLAIGGEPATGKSAAMQAYITHLRAREDPKLVHFQTCVTTVFEQHQLGILGRYTPGERFPGTDRLSMSVQPHALAYLTWLHTSRTPQVRTVVFEGDRLFNLKFFSALRAAGIPYQVLGLQATEATKARRHRLRHDDQREVFLRSRATKVGNVLRVLGAEVMMHETEEDTGQVLAWLEAQRATPSL